jgi:hypothetical protein
MMCRPGHCQAADVMRGDEIVPAEVVARCSADPRVNYFGRTPLKMPNGTQMGSFNVDGKIDTKLMQFKATPLEQLRPGEWIRFVRCSPANGMHELAKIISGMCGQKWTEETILLVDN